MTEYFAGKRWAITGRLTEISRKEATAQLKELGAAVTGGVTSKTDFLVSGGYDPNETRFLSSKEKTARQRGIPIFNEPQLLAILAGDEPELIEELAPEQEVAEPVGTRDALEGFRELVHEELDEGTWARICELLDRCEARDLPVVLKYVESSLGDDGPCPVEWWSDSPSARYHRIRPIDPRALPSAWVLELLGGSDHPKFGIARVGDFRRQKIKGAIGDNLLACSHLGRLRALDLVDNAPPMKFWKAVAEAPQFAKLSYLGIGGSKLNASTTGALAAAPFVSTIDTLVLDGTSFPGTSARPFFVDGVWPRLTRLEVSYAKSPAGNLHDALRDSAHIDGLTHLIWKQVEGSASGFGRLVAAPQFASVTHLHYAARDMGTDSLEALAGATHLRDIRQLTLLDLGYGDGPEAMSAVLGAPQFESVEELVVSVDNAGVEALMRATHMERLRSLYVTFGREPTTAWEDLLTAPHLQGLERLHLRGRLPDGFLARFFASGALPGLKRLQIHNTSLDDDALRAIAAADHWALEDLDAHAGDGVTADAVKTAMSAEHLPDHGLRSALRWTLDQLG